MYRKLALGAHWPAASVWPEESCRHLSAHFASLIAVRATPIRANSGRSGQLADRGQELALSEITRCAEDDQRARWRPPLPAVLTSALAGVASGRPARARTRQFTHVSSPNSSIRG